MRGVNAQPQHTDHNEIRQQEQQHRRQYGINGRRKKKMLQNNSHLLNSHRLFSISHWGERARASQRSHTRTKRPQQFEKRFILIHYYLMRARIRTHAAPIWPESAALYRLHPFFFFGGTATSVRLDAVSFFASHSIFK